MSSCLPRIRLEKYSAASYYAEEEKVLFYREGKDWLVKEPMIKNDYQATTTLGKVGITQNASFKTRKEAVEATCAALGLKAISFKRSGRYGKWLTEDGFFFFYKEEDGNKLSWYIGLTRKGTDHFQIEHCDEALWLKVNGLREQFPTMKAARQAIAALFPKKYPQVV